MTFLSNWLALHPSRVVLVVFLLLVPLLSFFAFNPFNIESDVRRGFAIKDGRSIDEFKSFADFYNISYEGLEIWVVLVTAKTNSSTPHLNMSQQLLNEITRLDDYVQDLTVEMDGETVALRNMEAAKINYIFDWYKYAYQLQSIFPGTVNLTFPVGKAMGHDFFLGSHFFGVNKLRESERGPIETVQFVTLWYMSQAGNFQEKKKLEALQMELFRRSQKDNFSDLISYQMYGDQVANAEMLRGTMDTVKLFILGVFIMVIFMLFMFSHLTFKSQIMLTVAALGAPTAATAACFAILGWAGIPFNSIMCITPFLIMGIGVDDAFLLMHSWRRRLSCPSPILRLQTVIREIGPSMAITSVTNTLAFGIGIFSPTAQMSGFCLCTAIAVLFDFVFEFVIFVPCMVMYYEEKHVVKKEEKSRSCFSWWSYVRMLLSPFGKFSVIVFTVLLYTSAYVGVDKLIPSFDPSKTFPSDSGLMDSLRNFEIIQMEYAPVNFITRRIPSLHNETELAEFYEMIHKLENRPYCYGPERTQILFRNYITLERLKNQSTLSYNDLEEFLLDRMVLDKGIMHFHKNASGDVILDGTNFIVICKGDISWNRRAHHVDEARAIVDSYPQFETTLFDYDSTIYDLIITVKGELIKAVLLTFISMAIACSLMIPSLVGASVATLSMLSISFSLLGWLSIWGQDLDPVTMINVLMAIGFSVDYSAHVCYHFHLNSRAHISPEQRAHKILQEVGRPMIEASLSTLLCMCPLFLVKVYIIEAFARTVCLVATLGLLHGLVIIPVVLSFFSPKFHPVQNSPSLASQTTTVTA